MKEISVDTEQWADFETCAESWGMTGTELVNAYVKHTVSENRERIQKYRVGINELRARLNLENGGFHEARFDLFNRKAGE